MPAAQFLARMPAGAAVLCAVLSLSAAPAPAGPPAGIEYRLEPLAGGERELRARFDARQIGILEQLNRRDLSYLARLREIIVPQTWPDDELAYSPLPRQYAWAAAYPKALVVHQPWQVFGAYEHGALVRWGALSSGRRSAPTPAGLFHLNWRSPGRCSTVCRDWYMPWYWNFDNQRGLALHQFTLPGHPASHACIRLLERDARWLFDWGEGWQLDPTGRTVLRPGTPVFVVGEYDFDAPPPWRSPEQLAIGPKLADGPAG
ncbi:MAG: L,D-transpeptidase [Gammaproteobacteria bacterium]|nr:L,D-transpeptidase [Gammaproteobacteria bacterium]